MKKITLLAMSFMMALMVKAQGAEDVTSLLANPDFENGTTSWDGTFVTQGSAQPNFSGTFLERWAGYYAKDQSTGVYNEDGVEYYKLIDLFCSQTIAVDNGFYVLEAYVNAVQQNLGSLNPVTGVLLFANDDVTSCATGNGQPELFKVGTVVTDGSLTVGLRTESTTANWIAWDNLKLVRYTGATIDEAKTLWAKDEMNLLKEELELLIENPMSAELRDAINDSFAAIETVTTYVDANALWNTMKAQAEEAEACIVAYEKLIEKIYEVFEMADNNDNTDDLYDAADAAQIDYDDELLSAAEALATIDALNQAVYEYEMSIADGSIAFDVTERYVTNAALRDNNKGWLGTSPVFGQGVAEFFDKNFDVYQEITGIPNGKYVVKVQGFYRQGWNDAADAYNAGTEELAELYANDEEVSLTSLYKYTAAEMGVTENVHGNGQVDGLTSANLAFSTMNSLTGVNYYDENSVTVIVMDGKLKFGLRNSNHKGGSWCAFRDFKLFYYGNFPSVNLLGKMNVARAYLEANEANIPAAVYFMVDEYLYNLDGEGYTEEGAYSDEEVNAVILAFDAMWAEALAAVDLFANLKAKVADVKDNLLPLEFPGADDLWTLVYEAEDEGGLFDPENEENTYEALLDFETRLNEGIVAYYTSQEASEDIAADYTYFVPNPNFEQKGEWTWSVAGGGSDQWNGGCRPSEEGGANRQGVNLWGWGITSVDVHQTLTGLPNGLYKVSAELITQTNYATDQHVYATGAATVTSDYLTVTGWDTYEWTTLTTNGFAVVVDGTLTIGAASSKGGTNSEAWFQATNFKLYYYGPASSEHLQGAWESLKAEAEEAVDVLLPSEEKEVVATLASATSVADAGNYAEACELMSATLEVWDSTIVASKNFYGGYYAKLDTIRLYDAYDGCEMVYSFADAAVALADVILASDTTTCKVFPALNEQLHAYANYASTLRDAEREMEDTIYAAEHVAFVNDEVLAPQLETLLAALVTVEKCDALRADLQKAIEVLKGTANYGKEINEGDVTYLIVNPGIEVVDGAVAGWTILKNNAQNCGTNNNEHYSGVTNAYLDAWHPTAGTNNATFYQEIGGIPDGTYELTVAARTDGNNAFIFAATASSIADASTEWAEVKNYAAWRGEIWEADSLQWEADGKPEDDLNELYPYFMARPTDNTLYGEGYGWSWHTIEVEVTNHVLTIGLTTDAELSGKNFSGTWMGADDWSLKLVKINDVQSEYNPFLGVENIEVAAPVVKGIYDLFGRRIDAITAPGLYIVNGKKVLVK